MRKYSLLAVFTLTMIWAWPASAQVDEPTAVVIERYHFQFTVEANSLVTMPENGDGFSAIHNPVGGGENSKPDYGLLVYGGMFYNFSEEEAKAAGIEAEEGGVMLAADDIRDNTRLGEILKDAMGSHEREPAGEAIVGVKDGPSIKVPYFIWSVTRGTRTGHALMYTVIHGDAFITIMVDSHRPFSKQQISWFTTHLGLLKIPLATIDE